MSSWKCGACKKYCRASAQYCPTCGRHWEVTYQAEIPYAAAQAAAPWNNGGKPRAPSPRIRQSPRRRPRKDDNAAVYGQQEGKKGKGKGKAASKDNAAPRGKDRMAMLPAPPTTQPPAVTLAPTTAATETTANPAPEFAELLATLVSAGEDLPASVQQALDAHSDLQHRSSAKALHRVVAQQAAAQKGITEVRRARAAFMAEWVQYLGSLTDLLLQQIEEKNQAMTNFKEAEDKWATQLSTATKTLAQATKPPDSVIDVDESENMEAEVMEVAADDAKQSEANANTAEQEAQLTEQLKRARGAAQEELQGLQARERTPRRARVEPTEIAAVAKAASQNSQPPRKA